MAHRVIPGMAPVVTAGAMPASVMEQISGREVSGNTPAALAGSAAVYENRRSNDPKHDRMQVAQQWQHEVYRHINICGEARYAATLFANIAGRAEIGISDPQAMRGKAAWINSGPEVDALAVLAPTVRERTKLIRDY